MNIEPINGDRLRVWLDHREIRRCRLDKEHYDRRALRRLVRRALSAYGTEPSIKTVAEMIPVADGWVLLISPSPSRQKQTKTYWFTNGDILHTFLHRWERVEPPLCALYEMEQGYALTVYGADALTPWHSGLLEEYGQLWGVGEALAAHAAEYGRLTDAGYVTADGRRPPTDGDREN